MINLKISVSCKSTVKITFVPFVIFCYSTVLYITFFLETSKRTDYVHCTGFLTSTNIYFIYYNRSKSRHSIHNKH